MKQTITALIRPRLNLSNPNNQLNHLIEHIFLSDRRQQQIGMKSFWNDELIDYDGYTSELYMSEHYISSIKLKQKIKKNALDNKQKLFLQKVNTKKQVNILKEELLENNYDNVTISEYYDRSIYTKDSPSIVQPWFDISSIRNATNKTIKNVFDKYSLPTHLIQLEHDKYCVPKMDALNKNKIKSGVREIVLTHPDQSTKASDITVVIPYNDIKIDMYSLVVFVQFMIDGRFGYLVKNMIEDKGIVYRVNMYLNMYNDSIEISFSCSKGNINKCLQLIKEGFDAYSNIDRDTLTKIIKRLDIKYQLEWGNVSDYALFYIEEVVLSNMNLSPKERIKMMYKKSIPECKKDGISLAEALNNKSIIVHINYSNKTSSKYLSKSFY